MNDAVKNSVQSRKVYKLSWIAAFIIILVVVADQCLKFWVKTHFYLGEDLEIFPWFHLKFIENNGFAFGLEWFNKFLLTFGRIAAVIFFIWALRKILLTIPNIKTGLIISFALIIAGAAGNIFDCVFYGEIFNNPYPPEIATLFPVGGGYAGWFEGRVVDMLYFPLFNITWPEWIPGIGGERYEFFQYIFNIADAAITVGVLVILIFYSSEASYVLNRLFHKDKNEESKSKR